MDVVDMADEFRNDFPCAVVGIDVASGENHFSADSPLRKGHYDMCQRAQKLGLNITIHAGETPHSAQNVQNAIGNYGAKRIGHGYHMAKYPEIMDYVKAQNIHIEVCPTSSVETGAWQKTVWTDHPACEFQKRGISQSLSSDDPAVFNTSLTWQYRIALKKMGWSKEDVIQMTQHAISAAFISEAEKASLREQVETGCYDKPHLMFCDRVHYE